MALTLELSTSTPTTTRRTSTTTTGSAYLTYRSKQIHRKYHPRHLAKITTEGQSSRLILEKLYKVKEMKRVGFIYEKICSDENIRVALQKACEFKKHRLSVRRIMENPEKWVGEVRRQLVTKTFHNTPCVREVIKERPNGKERLITKPAFFPDQIVHRALMLQVIPLIMRGMDRYCSGNIPERGAIYAKNGVEHALRSDPKNTKYCLKLDIKKFYPSIDISILKQKLRRLIKDSDVLALFDEILKMQDSGLPIGTYTSQWLSNFYLQDMDHFIREGLHVKFMVRYVDDIVILGPNKRELHMIKRKIEAFLKAEKLTLKDDWQIFRVAQRPVDFVGYKMYPQRTIIRKRVWKSIRRLMLKLRKKITLARAKSFMAYNGYIAHSDSHLIKKKYFKSIHVSRIRQILREGT